MSDFILILLVIGGIVLFLGVLSNLFKHWGLPDPLIVLLLGGKASACWILKSLLVCASVVVHGITSTPFTRLYGKHVPQSDQEKSSSS
jgi:hypothetical protein